MTRASRLRHKLMPDDDIDAIAEEIESAASKAPRGRWHQNIEAETRSIEICCDETSLPESEGTMIAECGWECDVDGDGYGVYTDDNREESDFKNAKAVADLIVACSPERILRLVRAFKKLRAS